MLMGKKKAERISEFKLLMRLFSDKCIYFSGIKITLYKETTVRMPLNVFSMIWITEQHIKCLTSPRFVKLN